MKALAFSFLLLASFSFAAPPATAPKAAPAKQSSVAVKPAPATPTKPPTAAPKPQVVNRVISDAWYTVTVNKVIHYEYYNERMEIKNNRFFVQQKLWKNEEDFVNEEQMGAFAEYNTDFTPVFFNYHSNYRSTETSIDGTVTDNKLLTVKIKKGSNDLPLIKKMLPSKTMLSSFFNLWMTSKLPSLKEGQTASFQAVLEDNLELAFSPVSGMIRLEKPDAYAKANQATQISLDFNNLKSTWYLDKAGVTLRTLMPEQNAIVERVTEDKAKHFLE